MTRIHPVVVLLLGLLCPPFAHSQTVIHSDPFASSGSASRNIVRAADGTLHAVSFRENAQMERELIVHSSTNGGGSWVANPTVLNDATSGLTAPGANACTVAIDSQGTLHITWGRYYYPSEYNQFYRNFNPQTGVASGIVNLSAIFGAPPTARTAANSIVVDANDTVWFAGHDPSSWVEHLYRSDTPSASNLTFTDVGAISPSGSAQNSRLAVDVAGRIHCTFYRNISQGQYEHRAYDPFYGWDILTTNLGNTTAPNDYFGDLAADSLGHVHVVYVADATATSTLWNFRYRRWDPMLGVWGASVPLFAATNAQFSGVASYRIFSLGCEAATGKVFVAHRDLGGNGALRLVEKELNDTAFTLTTEITAPSTALHVYHVPTIRGTLHPASNHTDHGVHVAWQHRPMNGVPPYELSFYAEASAQFRRGDFNNNGTVNLQDIVQALGALFLPGSPQPTCFDAADGNDDGTFNLTDPVFVLNYLFVPASPAPAAPGPLNCGVDPTPSSLGCATSAPGCP